MTATRCARTPLLAMILLAAGCSSSDPPGAALPSGPGDIEIRRTEYGVVHVKAADYAGLGEGYGYAFAQDNLCVIADSYVTVNGERSRYFGPDASWHFAGNSTVNRNLDSDFF